MLRQRKKSIHWLQCFLFWRGAGGGGVPEQEGFPGGSAIKNLPANARDTEVVSSIPGSGRSPRGGNGNPLHCSCLGNPMDRGAWWATAHIGSQRVGQD